MLNDLAKTVTRLQASEPSSSHLPSLLKAHYSRFSDMIRRIEDCSIPCIKRILAEDVFEAVDWILRFPSEEGRHLMLEQTTLWQSFQEDVRRGCVLDFEYAQYLKAKRFVERWLEHSYLEETSGSDDKTKRYAYALSGEPLPDWLREDLLIPRLDAVVTAYCNMLIAIFDYAESYTNENAKGVFPMTMTPAALHDEFLTPEIGQALPMLDETCAMLTRQSLILALTEETKKWVQGDPELADILIDRKKSLEECVRYIMEKAAKVAKTNAEAMTGEQVRSQQETVRGQRGFFAGVAISDEQVFQWAKEYYYQPDVKPTSATITNTSKAAGTTVGKAGSKKKGGKKAEKPGSEANKDSGSKQEDAASAGADAPEKVDVVDEEPEQFSLFSSGQPKAA